jgi:hypothetical protein
MDDGSLQSLFFFVPIGNPRWPSMSDERYQ